MQPANDRNARALVQASLSGALPAEAADPLTDALAAVRLTGALFFIVEASYPYCIDVPPARAYADIILPEAQHVFSYHLIQEGSGVARVPGEPPVEFEAGDVILFPQGDAYLMGTTLKTRPEFDLAETLDFFRALAAGSLPFTVEEGGGGRPLTRVICGFLGCDRRPFNPVVAALPRLTRIPGALGESGSLLDGFVRLAISEGTEGARSGKPVRLRLAELMFIEVLRRHLRDAGPARPGLIAGMRDASVARALAALHAEPESGWTVEALADRARLSRSAFARRFAAALGEPPLRYLMLWRMQLAARMLTETSAPVSEIGRRVGYGAEAAFSRGFKRAVGVSPEAWRRGGAHTAPTYSPRAG